MLTINPKNQKTSYYVEAVILKMPVDREYKVDVISRHYKEQKIPEAKVDMIYLLSALSKGNENREQFIRDNFDKLEETTPVP